MPSNSHTPAQTITLSMPFPLKNPDITVHHTTCPKKLPHVLTLFFCEVRMRDMGNRTKRTGLETLTEEQLLSVYHHALDESVVHWNHRKGGLIQLGIAPVGAHIFLPCSNRLNIFLDQLTLTYGQNPNISYNIKCGWHYCLGGDCNHVQVNRFNFPRDWSNQSKMAMCLYGSRKIQGRISSSLRAQSRCTTLGHTCHLFLIHALSLGGTIHVPNISTIAIF